MSDPLSEVATTERPAEPLLGLRRRHQAGLFNARNNFEEEEDPADNFSRRRAEVNNENRDENEPRPVWFDFPSRQDTHSNNNQEDSANNHRTRTEEQPSQSNNPFSPLSGTIGIGMFRISRLYCFLSILSALAAIVLSPIPIHKIQYHDVTAMVYEVGSAPVSSEENKDLKTSTNILDSMTMIATELKSWSMEEFIAHAAFLGTTSSQKSDSDSSTVDATDNEREKGGRQRKRRRRVSDIVNRRRQKFEGIIDDEHGQNENKIGDDAQQNRLTSGGGKGHNRSDAIKRERLSIHEAWQWVDPIFFEDGSFSFIFTNVVDKILKSTVRLCVITNFLLTMTYLVHSGVAAWFLAHSGASANAAALQRQHETSMREDRDRMGTEWSFASPSGASVARERMGGFLIFKLLLISAVLTPDALDLMILVTWFTLLGCLRSLDHLAHSINIHLTAMGQRPENGIVQLLCWVLVCDIVAAGSCVALFHTAGYGMVLLLTCDCALLGTDAVSHVLKYYQSIWDNSHDYEIRALEEQQLNLHRSNGQNSTQGNIPVDEGMDAHSLPTTTGMTRAELREASGRLDHQMEELELDHTRRLSILDTAMFCLDMTCHVLTVAHFCHIWALHGVQFTLIDGVLALHLHSAISSACAKLARRRNVHKIAKDLEGHFLNATDDELKQAATAGDVCCICLGSMSKGGNVKKAQCGHMYHTHCLREVIERAQSLESAKCPLCRAPLIDECHSNGNPSGRNDRPSDVTFSRQNNDPVDPRIPEEQRANHTIGSRTEGEGGDNNVQGRPIEGEEALFRFSTEGILPAWMPLPAFSFEVVRRPPPGAPRAAPIQNQQIPTAASTQRIDPADTPFSNREGANAETQTEFERQTEQEQRQDEETQMPFFQRILHFTGLIPMTPEEEARALAQLVDMFPQYDRSDLSRELRYRGSLEAVAEAILIGIVPGIPRGE